MISSAIGVLFSESHYINLYLKVFSYDGFSISHINEPKFDRFLIDYSSRWEMRIYFHTSAGLIILLIQSSFIQHVFLTFLSKYKFVCLLVGFVFGSFVLHIYFKVITIKSLSLWLCCVVCGYLFNRSSVLRGG